MSQPVQEGPAPADIQANDPASEAALDGGPRGPGIIAELRGRGLGPAAVLAALWAITPAACGFLLLAYIDTVSQWLRAHGNAGLVLYTAAFMIAGGLGLLPTYAQAVLGGWCFALLAGFPAALAGFTGAALLGYAVSRTVARRRVEDAIEANAKARAMRNALIGHGFWKTTGLVTLVRLPPNSPFALTNMALSSTGVPLAAFALGTVLGMAPRTGVAVFLGSTIETLTSDTELVPRPVKMGMAAASVALLVVIYWIGRRTWDRVTAQQGAAGPGAPAA